MTKETTAESKTERLLKEALPWLSKAVADGVHINCIYPAALESLLQEAAVFITELEGQQLRKESEEPTGCHQYSVHVGDKYRLLEPTCDREKYVLEILDIDEGSHRLQVKLTNQLVKENFPRKEDWDLRAFRESLDRREFVFVDFVLDEPENGPTRRTRSIGEDLRVGDKIRVQQPRNSGESFVATVRRLHDKGDVISLFLEWTDSVTVTTKHETWRLSALVYGIEIGYFVAAEKEDQNNG
jgi:hypothetical protein